MAALPAYMRIRQYVVDLIMTHDQGDMRIMSERELCREFGVTRPTARRALKELVDDGYLETRPGLGMFVNPTKVANNSMAVRKSYKVLLVFGDGRYTDLDGFSMDILARLSDRMKSLPIRLRIASLNYGDRETALNELEMYNPDGLIWVRPNQFGLELIDAVKQKFSTVTTGRVAAGRQNHVTVDYRLCGRQAAAWFLDRGMKNTVFVGNAPGQMSVKEEVFSGWCDEYKARGFEFDIMAQADMNSNISEKLKKLMSERKVEGIFSFGSEYAVVDTVLEDLNICDKECPVIADENYYGFYGAKFQPAAKIIMSPPEESEQAVDRLFAMMQKSQTEFDEIVIKPKQNF